MHGIFFLSLQAPSLITFPTQPKTSELNVWCYVNVLNTIQAEFDYVNGADQGLRKGEPCL